MRKTGILRTMAKNYKRKATVEATTALYQAIWGEKPKRGKKKNK